MMHMFKQPSLFAHYIYCSLLCIIVFAGGCATPGSKPSRSSTPAQSEVGTQNRTTQRSTSVSNTTGNQLVSVAESLVGSPYKYGGSTPRGFDCSGLVYYTHSQLGISVPRTTRQQARYANLLTLGDVERGDLLFFRIYGDGISHVGIYAGDNQFIHAPKSGKYVSHASIDNPYWRDRLVKVGRLH